MPATWRLQQLILLERMQGDNTNTNLIFSTFPFSFHIHLFIHICQLLDVRNNYFYWNTIFVTCSIKWPCMCAETLWWGIPLHKSDRFVTDTILQFTTLHNSRLVGFPQIASTCRNHALVRVSNVLEHFLSHLNHFKMHNCIRSSLIIIAAIIDFFRGWGELACLDGLHGCCRCKK